MRLLIKNGYVITLDEKSRVYDRGNVLIEGGVITWIGEGDPPQNPTPSPPLKIIDASRRIVMPGLVNCHLHSTAGYWKGAIDALPLEVFLLYAHPYASRLRLSEEQLYLRHMTSAIEMLESGTTATIDDTVHMASAVDPRPDVAFQAYRESLDASLKCYSDTGMRATVTCNVLDRAMYKTIPWLEELLPSELRAELDSRPFPETRDIIDFLDETVGAVKGNDGSRVRVALAPNSASRCTDELLTSVAGLARKHDVQIVSHIQESKTQYVQDHMNYGKSAIAHLRDVGVLDERVGLIHAVWLSEDDLDTIVGTGCSVITNPVSNLKLGSGIAPVLHLIESGAHVALGTDGPTGNDSANLFEAMKMLALVQRIWTSEFQRWPRAVDVLKAATLGGAYALGEQNALGSIEVGKRADMTLLDRDAISYAPFHRPINQIVYADTGGSVDIVIVDGEIVVENGRVTKIPRDDILQAFYEAYKRVNPAVEEAVKTSARYQPYVEEAYRRASAVQTPMNPVLWQDGE